MMRFEVRTAFLLLILIGIVSLTGCDSSVRADTAEGLTSPEKAPSMSDIRVQSLSFSWQGQSLRQDVVCAPTAFPPFAIGGGDPFSGAAPGQGRDAALGWSPVPQWAVIETSDTQLILRRACAGQWSGLDQLSATPAAEKTEAYILSTRNGVAGLSPTTLSNLSLKDQRTSLSDNDLSEIVTGQMRSLAPAADLLRPFPKATLADPVLISLSEVLPVREERPFRSEPWLVRCNGALPEAGTSAAADGTASPLFLKPGQDVLTRSEALAGCEFIERVNVDNIDYNDRPRSPYAENVLHLITESGEEAFIDARQMTLRQPEVFLHAETRGSYRGQLERDPFLDSAFYRSEIADILSALDMDAVD